MSHIQEIPRYKCQGACGLAARYEVVNDRSAVIGRFCKRCAERELYTFQHPKPERAPTGRIGPVATAAEASGLDDAMRKAGL